MNDSDIISCFGVALGHFLKENEGIIVELIDQNKYMVVHQNGKIAIIGTSEEDKHLENGQLIWYHSDEPLH